ncbi:MAG: CbtB-domain containing protein [Rhodoferax sp.]|uniref:CbtB domain-containing protein n=1 Tax=Rhodoferax sp. TaxID=50421 RepID=UPI001859DBCB|nr:CbtB domain-containing protein [Rhodoferax sp.]NMM13985.1 CbtB-domain containing protein [Rhodoferax sp.]NMM19500.1 CbtB-domain containing protein [Rhodoferax sp.]
MNISTPSITITPTTTAAISMLAQLGAALLLGLVMLYAVGFSEASVAHNAAHDVRHATGRPCH